MKSKTIKTIIAFMFACIHVYAQNYKIEGFVSDTNKNLLSYATVCLINATDSTSIGTVITKDNGSFEFKCQPGNYILKVYCFSYQPAIKKIQVNGNKTVDIILDKTNVQLKEVVVTANKKLIHSRDGNIVIDVTQISQKNETLGDLMDKLPGVMNQNNKSVTLYGTQAVIYIDGVKQNSMVLENYLKSMPADHYAEVELISIPDGSTEASSGAVIKIKTKQKRNDGYSITVNQEDRLSQGHHSSNPYIFYMAKKKNIDYDMYLTYSNQYTKSSAKDSTDYAQGRNLLTNSTIRERDNNIGYNCDLNIHLKHDAIIKWNAFARESFSKPQNNWTTAYKNGISIENNNNHSKQFSHDDIWSTNLQYENSDSTRLKVIASYGFVYGGQRSNSHYYNDDNNLPYLHSNLQMTSFQHLLDIDFTEKLGKHKIFWGTDLTYGHINDNADYNNSETVPTSLCSEREIIWSLWGGWKYNISDKLSMRASLRSEYTNFGTYLKSSPDNNKAYWNVFPYAALTYSVDKYTTTFGLMSSIVRPNYLLMVPGIRYQNDFLYTKGNAFLRPTKQYALVWNNLLFNAININVQYRYRNDLIGPVYINYDNGILESTCLNYSDQRSLWTYICIPFNLFKNSLRGQIMSNATYDKYVNISSEYPLPDNRKLHFWNFTENLYLQYNHKRFTATTYAKFYPKYSALQSDTKYRWSLYASTAYDFLKKKNLTLSLSANDIFNTMRTKTLSYIGNVYKQDIQTPNSRMFSISISYRFDNGAHLNKNNRNKGNNVDRFSK